MRSAAIIGAALLCLACAAIPTSTPTKPAAAPPTATVTAAPKAPGAPPAAQPSPAAVAAAPFEGVKELRSADHDDVGGGRERGAGKPTAAPAARRTAARVVRVVDGDTLDLALEGRTERVRLIGVNTPESVDPRRPVECLGREASVRAKELLPAGADVQVEPDPTQDTRDRFGRLLLYVYLPSGQSLGLELIGQGFANEYTYDRPYRDQALHRAAQREAQAAERGLWAPGACETEPTPARQSKPGPTAAPAKPAAPALPVAKAPAPGNCDASYPDVCIAPPPPDLDCPQVPFRRFRVVGADPHRFDADRDGVGCE
jgi:micrococcal nuclease